MTHPKPFLPHISRPIFGRLPERKAVTIVAGFNCTDGIVICADTEHNAGVSKFERRKIVHFDDEECSVRFGYAGNTDYTDMAIDKMRRSLAGKGKTVQGIKDAFEEISLDVYNRHIKGFFDMHDPNRPQILLLAGIRLASGEMQLVKVTDTAVSPVASFDALGTGEYLARSMADWLYDEDIPVRLMRVIAINIVQQTKRYASGVGGSTHVSSLTRERQRRSVSLYDDSQFFWGIQGLLRPILLGCMDEAVSDEVFQQAQNRLIELFRDVRQAIKHQEESRKEFFRLRGAQPDQADPAAPNDSP